MTPGELAVELRGAPASILKTLAREVRAAGLRAEGQARENVGARLQVRSGQLRRSVQADLVEEGPGALLLRLRAGGGTKELAYARVQELGGTIRPRNGRFLAIPWRGGPALTAGPPDTDSTEIRRSPVPGLLHDRRQSAAHRR